jgi:hypothetical protein
MFELENAVAGINQHVLNQPRIGGIIFNQQGGNAKRRRCGIALVSTGWIFLCDFHDRLWARLCGRIYPNRQHPEMGCIPRV